MRLFALSPLFTLLAACDTGGFTPEERREDTADTADSGDTGFDPGDDTVGPALPDCTATTGDGDYVALSGVVLLPDGATAGVVVYQRSTGLVTCAGATCDTSRASVVCTEGVISPGLIDPHNHLQYNSLPRWEVPAEFEDRYDWQGDDRYDDFKDAYNDIEDAYNCEIMKWAEAREIVHGTTSAVGSSGSGCIDRGVRNLDEDADASHLESYDLSYSSGNVDSSIEDGDGQYYNDKLASGSLDAVMNHVAEGRDGNVQGEIDTMLDAGMTGPGQVYVHATDASTEQLAQLGATQTGIVWSPRSNLVLYATTTPIEIADNLGVPWAIGSDWTPSGSIGQPAELACAEAWLAGKGSPFSDVDLWRKATEDAARLVGADGVLGVLTPGGAADIAVFDYSPTPYRAIIGADEASVRLVVVAGEAVYGRTALVEPLAENVAWCDTIDACGESRSYCLKDGESGDNADTLAEVEATLEAALSAHSMPSGYEYAGELFGLYACADERSICDLREPASGDDDGDGVADSGDVCAGIYDPNQWDTDGDGLGDSCDECPMVPGTDCELDVNDVDGDGTADDVDNCPGVNNDQTDTDGDGAGDACDACPDEPNPDGGGCTATVYDLRTGVFPDLSPVSIEGVVVTAIRAGAGFFVQVPGATEYGGIYVYDGGDNVVSVGDLVTVSGTYTEYYEMSELTDATATITGVGEVPAPLALDTCAVAANAEPTESMLVTFSNARVTDENADADAGVDTPDYDEYVVDECLRVDDFLDETLDQPAQDTLFNTLTGVMIYSFDNVKLAPRGTSDLEVAI
ncbi:hypothetical protein LBMAG42_16180 [Deltaproteobacteria bacterium]|nr:hypothetical protein LBMAG42_16180 [Deltaproteobacteria bacterium]